MISVGAVTESCRPVHGFFGSVFIMIDESEFDGVDVGEASKGLKSEDHFSGVQV